MHPVHRATLVVVSLAVLDSIASAQTSAAVPPSEKNFFIGTPAGWKQPKTPWGDPDLQGIWPLSYVGNTPLQRCFGPQRPGAACDSHKEFLTEEEYKVLMATAAKAPDRFATAAKQGEAGRAFLAGVTDVTTPQRQTSLIFDPPDGKLPEMTPEGKRLASEMKSSWPLPGENLVFDSYKDFDLWDRCITRGMPVSMFPSRYNTGVEIIQAPGGVTILMEMIHDARTVPLNDNTPVPPQVKQWMGVPRGHWEGNTLVIESSNFRGGASLTNTAIIGSPPGNRFPTSDQMKITEKFTRINDQFLIYEIAVADPVVLTHPWTARFPLKLANDYELLEYTCHEDNRVITDWKDKRIMAAFYGVQPSTVDDSIWGQSMDVGFSRLDQPGYIIRLVPGPNPSETALAEVYQPPDIGYGARGIDLDNNGVVWTALSSGHLASFDRRKCKGPLNGPSTVEGKQCREGWILYQFPGPQFKGVTDPGSADHAYFVWVDRNNTLGLGANVPIAEANGSESLLALVNGKFVTIHVPYPMGFFGKNVDGRIDDPATGWKGRGLWTTTGTRTVFHNEGGTENRPKVYKVQMRPDPLAR